MECEILLSKFFKLMIFFQTYLFNIPITLNMQTLELSPEPIKLPRHLFFILVPLLGVQIFILVLIIITIRIFLVVPRSSPQFPNMIETIFFWFYLSVANLIISAAYLILKEKANFCSLINTSLRMILTYRIKGVI